MSGPIDDDVDLDRAGQAEIEGRTCATEADGFSPKTPPAGPHAASALTDDEATPGAGSLPGTSSDDEADAGTG